MNTAIRNVASTAAFVLLISVTFACGEPLRPAQIAPGQLTWAASPHGYQQSLIIGDPSTPGMYAVRVKFPPGLRIQPHFHPDDRIVTVLSGTVLMGYGEQFDEREMNALPAGSVWTEPAKQPHFAWAKDGQVILQVIGNGPSGETPVQPRQ